MRKVGVPQGRQLSPWRWQGKIVLGAALVFSGFVGAQTSGRPQSLQKLIAPNAGTKSAGAKNAAAKSVAKNADSKTSSPAAVAVAAEPVDLTGTGETGKRAQSYYHFALGHLYEQSAEQYGRPDMATQAVEQYKLAITRDPDSTFLQNQLAETYFKLGRIREAVETAQRILKTHPDDLAAHQLLGRVYLRSLGDTEAGQQPGPMLNLAIQEYQKLIVLAPDKIENHLLLGQLYEMKHDTVDAKAQFEVARQLDPGSEDVVLSLARLYAAQHKTAEATRVLKEVPEEERTPKIDIALGAMYDQGKELHPAIDAYQHALTLQPDNLDAQRGLAEDLFSDNQLAPATKLLEGVTVQDPEDVHSFLRLAELERMQGHLGKAEKALDHARTLDADGMEVRYNEALIAEAKGDFEQAATLLEQLAESTKHANGVYTEDEKNNRAIFLDRLAGVYRDQNKTTQAVTVYEQMIALGGHDAERGYQGRVDAYREAKMFPQATAAAQQAAQALPKDTDMQLTLAGQLVETGQVKEGLALAKAQMQNNKQDRAVWLVLAQMYTRLHKWKEASAALDQAEKLGDSEPDKALIYFLRGSLQERQKHIDAAEVLFRQSLAIEPNNALALNYLGYMLADHGLKLSEALQLIEHAVRLDPENGAYLDSLGWAHYKLGQYAVAEQVLQRAIALIPTDPTVHDHLGELYASTGHLQQAVDQWQVSLKNYANSAAADAPAGDVSRVRKRLDKTKLKLAKEEAHAIPPRTL